MNKRTIKRLKIISLICVFILIVESIYILINIGKVESVYFEGINAISISKNNYFVAGSNNDNDMHFEKAKLSQFNNKKEKKLERLYNVGYNSAFFDILNDDGIVVVGSYEKSLEEHENNIRRALIVKYDEDGNILFEKDFKQLDNSKFTSVKKLEDDYIVTGQSIYKNTRIGNKDGGAVIVRYDKNGKLIWKNNYGDNKSAIFNDFVIANDYIFAVGYNSDNNGIIVKYDLNGNEINSISYEMTDTLGLTSIIYDNEYLYITGSVNNNDKYNAVLLKLNLDCVIIDEAIIDDFDVNRFNKVIIDSDNNLVAIGTITKVNNNKDSIEVYDYSGIIAKYDSDLEKIDSVLYSNEKDDYFTDIIEYDDKYIVVGYSSYGDGSYMSKFITYSKALKVLEVG